MWKREPSTTCDMPTKEGRKEVTFEPGDWVWLHFKSERFPRQRKDKLAPRVDGPFKILEKIAIVT